MRDETARELAGHLQRANEELARAVQLTMDECPREEFEVWRQRLASVLGVLVADALGPLYRERPSLAPESLRDLYERKREA